MSNIEVILVSSEPVKGRASKTEWRLSSLAFMRDSPFSVKVITCILRRCFVTLYIERDMKVQQSVCLLARS